LVWLGLRGSASLERFGHDAHSHDVVVDCGEGEAGIGAAHLGRCSPKVNEDLSPKPCLRIRTHRARSKQSPGGIRRVSVGLSAGAPVALVDHA
jgi:hypothetical protein